MSRPKGLVVGPYQDRTEFSIHTKKRYGIPLTASEQAELYEYRKEHRIKYTKKRQATVEGRAMYLLYGLRKRAAKEKLPCDIDLEWLIERIKQPCPVTGQKFDLTIPVGLRVNRYAPSIDRLRKEDGYVKSNCRVVVWIFNLCRWSFTDTDVRDFAKAYLDHNNQSTVNFKGDLDIVHTSVSTDDAHNDGVVPPDAPEQPAEVDSAPGGTGQNP